MFIFDVWWLYATLLVALILVALFVLWFMSTRVFKSRLKKIVAAQDLYQTEDAIKNFETHYPVDKLVRYSRRMERYSRQMGPRVVRETGLADKWIQKLNSSPSVTSLRRVLLYCPSTSLFKAFLAVSVHPRLRKFFFDWVQSEGEEKVLKLLAEACRGEEFDPAFCANFLETQGALFRELTSEQEWHARYFAYRFLLLDENALTEKSLEDGLADPHPLVRKTLTNSFSPDAADREKTWNILWDKLIHDPVYEVREAARKRIAKEFIDLYSLKDKTLTAEETARILELLDPDCQEDRTFAMATLEIENLDKELRYHAAAFLDRCGVLSENLAKNTLDDSNNLDHSVNILQKALEVNVSGFLQDYPPGDGAPLLAVSRLLSGKGGTQEDICNLEKKIFAFFVGKKIEPATVDIYTRTLEVVSAKGNARAFEILAEELSRRETDRIFLEHLLPRIPKNAEAMFAPILFRFLENTAFPAREELVRLLGTFSPEIVLSGVFRILNSDRMETPHVVRVSALKIMGHLHLPFCLQRILESLPTFRPEEAEEFAVLIADYPDEMFEDKVRILLASPDARIRASIMAILPLVKNSSFLKEIRASLKDVDPDVRVAAIKALLGFGEIKLLNQETSMLRDPIERVRIATVEVIARHGNAAAMEILKTITTDENETDAVKIGVILGLGQATSAEGIPILIDVLDSMDDFRRYAERALTMRTSKKDINRLIEIFKDAEPPLREKLIPVFKTQGREAEAQILEILKDEVASLKPYLVKILEESGYIDRLKKQLSHRAVEIRREAALQLSLMDTLPAFRGLVIAAKDPDQEVRVCVVKALEKLDSDQGREILEKLKEDPDNRIRKYTFWALERLDSLKME
ncbi:MAG: HEAT repeat domain-containing protein [Treponema sp.]|nr:HEAT repeat domain-containing protein [Treponema sp.]